MTENPYKSPEAEGIDDDVLGRLTFEAGNAWYTGQVCNEKDTLAISLDAGDLPACLARGREIVQRLPDFVRSANEYAIAELLALKNSGWLEEGEEPLIAEEFIARLRLEDINILPHGIAEFWYDDGDVFWGHGIVLTLEPDNRFGEAALFG